MTVDPDKVPPVKLADATLRALPAPVLRPTYDRSALTPGIVHIGVGNFHRAHQSWYLHRLMQQGMAHDWAILGAGVRPYDAEMRERLRAQDHLTTLINLDPAGTSAEVVGSMIDYLPVAEDNAPLIEAMAEPAIRIVAMTVTEGGYYTDPATGDFDPTHPDIRHDAAHPERPKTAFGAIVAALALRRARGLGPFTGLSCDNLRGNGVILQRTVVSLARLSDPDLADWIAANATFPNSMVDCIVPATGETERALVRDLGIDDSAPVTQEPFRQWVIEDAFCAGRPDWDLVGATFSDAVHDYEAMKIRILNAGHQLLANAGEILSVPTIADCMAHPQISAFFRKVELEEIVPHVQPVPGMTPSAYVELIAQRFANPAIRDTTRRVAFDGSARHTGFVLPIVNDALAAGTSIDGLCLAEALWARMCEGRREDGSRIEPNDPHWGVLTAAARSARHRPQAWLEQRKFYGDLATEPAFATTFEAWLNDIWADGCEATLAKYCGAAALGRSYS